MSLTVSQAGASDNGAGVAIRGGNLFPWRRGWRVWGELGRNYPDTVLSQALRSRLGQPDSVENLAKALATPGLQDFLRIRATDRSTWDNLLAKICAIINYGLLRIKNFLDFGRISLKASQNLMTGMVYF